METISVAPISNSDTPVADSDSVVVNALRGAIHHLESSCEAVTAFHAQKEALQNAQNSQAARIDEMQAQIAALQSDLGDASDLIESLQAQDKNPQNPIAGQNRDDDRDDQLQRDLSHARTQIADLEWLGLQTENLLQQFGALYSLNTEDLHAQVVQAACLIVGARVGILTDASALDAVAVYGLTEISPRTAYKLFEFTQTVLQGESLVIENVASETPDNCGFSNLIALPLAPNHPDGGVLLLADKRDGEFSAQDEYLLNLLAVHVLGALENARLIRQRQSLHFDTIAVLADAIETKDADNRGHCKGVMQLAVDVAGRLGLKGTALDEVRYAALLHDIGKVGIPDDILLNSGRLSQEEQQVMRAHAALGHDLVSDVPALVPLASSILHHHEKWDGTGYPTGLAGEAIPLAARIIGAVDSFDAMTTPRLYRNSVSAQEALEEMRRCAGTQFDPQIVDVLEKLMQDGQKTQEYAAARIEKAAKSARPRRDALKRSQEQSNYLMQVMEQEEAEQAHENQQSMATAESLP